MTEAAWHTHIHRDERTYPIIPVPFLRVHSLTCIRHIPWAEGHAFLVKSTAKNPFSFFFSLFIFFLIFFLFLFFFNVYFYFTLQYCIGFAIHWHESTTGVHAIPNISWTKMQWWKIYTWPETPLTAAHQAPPSLGFSRQEHWSGLPFPSPMHESEKWK